MRRSFLLAFFLLIAQSASAAVARNDSGTNIVTFFGTPTSADLTTFTVLAGMDQCLLGILTTNADESGTVAMTWMGAGLTEAGHQFVAGIGYVTIFYLVAPATGNQALHLTYGISANGKLVAINFSGAPGCVATGDTVTTTGSAIQTFDVTVNSSANDATVVVATDDFNFNSSTQTQFFSDGAVEYSIGTYALGGSPTVTHSFTNIGVNSNWGGAGVRISSTGGGGCVPDHLTYNAQPSNAILGASLGTVSVSIRDVSNTVCTSATNAVTLSKNGGATWGTLVSGSSLTHSAVSGVATWTDLSVTTTIGSGSIDASAAGLTGATSNSITISAAQTVYYIDPEYTATPRNGGEFAPWQSLSDSGAGVTDPWSTLNSALSGNDITVYFSARRAASDIDERSTIPINTNRNDASTHRLTFNGNAKYNTTNGTTPPIWMNYSGTSKFRITATTGVPIQSDGAGSNPSYMTFHGMKFVSHYGQGAVFENMYHLIFENNELYDAAGFGFTVANGYATTTDSGGGSGLLVDVLSVDDDGAITQWRITPGNGGTGYSGAAGCGRPSASTFHITDGGGHTMPAGEFYVLETNNDPNSCTPGFVDRMWLNAFGPGLCICAVVQGYGHNQGDHTVIQNNFIHHTFGEGVYVGSSSPDIGEGNSYTTGTNRGTTEFVRRDGTTGTGTGLTINIDAVTGGGAIIIWSLNAPGTGYALADIVSFDGSAGHAGYLEVISIGGGGAVTGLSAWHTSDDTLIQGNTFSFIATMGGESNALDIKGGNTNVRIIGNYIDNTGTFAGSGGFPSDAMAVDSASLIDSNFAVTNGLNAISLTQGWNNSFGKSNMVMRNNLFLGDWHLNPTAARAALRVFGPAMQQFQWQSPTIENNTFIGNSGSEVFEMSSDRNDFSHLISFVVNLTLKNNIFSQLEAVTGDSGQTIGFFGDTTFAAHDHNLVYWGTAGGPDFYTGTVDTTPVHYTTNYAMFEVTMNGTDPKVVSDTSPYGPTKLELVAGSGAIGNAANLSSSFTVDFCGNTRTVPWDIGGWKNMPAITNCVFSSTDILLFTTQPSNLITGTNFSPTVVVTAELSGITDPAFTGAVTLTINGCGAALTGTVTQSAVAGVATFTGLGAMTTAAGCMVTATASGVTSGTSTAFDVTAFPCVPDHLVFSSQPSDAQSGASIGLVSVVIKNAMGGTCNSAINTVTFSNHAAICVGMVLNGTTSGNAIGGVFSSSNLSEVGSLGVCELDAASSGLTGATSNPFNIIPPTQLVVASSHRVFRRR